jgi:voltage-gated potassium channel
MLLELAIAFVLLALCVSIHAAGITVLLGRVVGLLATPALTRLRAIVLLVETAAWLLGLHLVEIALWALVYHGLDCLPDFESAMYFSGVTYATVGYGDVLLPREWWLFGPIEGLTGILLAGLSTGVFLVVVNKLFERMRHAGRSSGS